MKNRSKPSKLTRLAATAALAGSALTGTTGCQAIQDMARKQFVPYVEIGDYKWESGIFVNEKSGEADMAEVLNWISDLIDTNDDYIITEDEYNRFEGLTRAVLGVPNLTYESFKLLVNKYNPFG